MRRFSLFVLVVVYNLMWYGCVCFDCVWLLCFVLCKCVCVLFVF